MAVLATVLGCVSVGLGLWGSFVLDLPSGPSIVLAAMALFGISILAPRVAR
jgi:zinc transport system permease protein